MTPLAAHADALAAPSSATAKALLLWAGAAVVAGGAAAAGLAPFAILTTILVLACVIGVLHSPFTFLWIIIALSGTGFGWTDTTALNIGGQHINVSGLRWALVILTCAVILVRLRDASVPRGLRGWFAFVVLAGLGILWAPHPFEAVKQFMLYAAPLLTAVVAMRVVNTTGEITALRSALYVAVALGAVVGLVPALAGEVLGGSSDPEGRLLNRVFGYFLVPIMALSLAKLRFGHVKHVLAVAGIFVLALGTLSRSTLTTMVVLPLLAMAGSSWRWRGAAVAAVMLFVLSAYAYEPVRQRIFADERRGFTGKVEISGTGQDARIELAGVQLSGRGLVWLRVWSNAVREPWLGHGTGSATRYLAESNMSRYALHPHNEYLRVFHDFGAIGVAVVLAAFAGVLLALRNVMRAASSPLTRELALAAALSWAAFALIAVFDNPLIYFFFFTQNVFLLTVLAIRSAQLGPAQ